MNANPTRYDKPRNTFILDNEDTIKLSPLGDEISVILDVGKENCNVIVPTEALDSDRLTIPAVQIGEIGVNILLSFPATSLGTSTCSVPKSQLTT